MHKKTGYLLSLVFTLFAFLAASCATPAIEVKSLDFSRLRDGSYEGSYTGSMSMSARPNENFFIFNSYRARDMRRTGRRPREGSYIYA